jgi:hypothetical protein
MRAPTSAELLDVWEAGHRQSLPRKALLLLASMCPESSEDELGALPIGRRDSLLLTLRVWLFGPELPLVTACPVCSTSLESTFRAHDLRLDAASNGAVHSIEVDGRRIAFRSPTTSDLLALHTDPNHETARLSLLARCLISADGEEGSAADASTLPASIVDAVSRAMSAADPQADVELALGCAVCGHRWTTAFDIVSFLWLELNAWALRTLRDVHTLARSYGWRELDVLALSPTRRQLYVHMCPP